VAWPLAQRARVDSSADAILSTDQRNRETYEKIGSLMPETTFAGVAVRHALQRDGGGDDRVESGWLASLVQLGCFQTRFLLEPGGEDSVL